MYCEKSQVLTKRDDQSASGESGGHSHHNESTKAYKDRAIVTSAEPQSPQQKSFPTNFSSTKNHTEHPHAASFVSKKISEFTVHSKQQGQGNLTSDETSKDSYSTELKSGYSSSNSSSSLLSNSSEPSSTLSSKLEGNTSNYVFYNHSGNTNLTWDSSHRIPVAASSNSSSPRYSLPQTAEQYPQDAHKIKLWCIGIGCFMFFICIGAAMAFAKKRLNPKGPAAFVRRYFRSNSNDSNRAVRDRSSIGAQFRTTEPVSLPSTLSPKSLVLRPESLSYIRSSSPRKPSRLHLRDQSLKSQISPPIMGSPYPPDYQPLYSGFSEKAMYSVPSSSSPPSSQSSTSLPSCPQSRVYLTSLLKTRPSISLNRDAGIRRGNVLHTAPGIPSTYGEGKSDSLTDKTPVPPRPPRPSFSLLPCSSVAANALSQRIEETEPVFPTVLPLNVPLRLQSANKHNRRHNSIDQVILDHPVSYAFQDSPTLQHFHHEERNSVLSTTREVNPTRISQLSRSTCYSQSSDPENCSIPEENYNIDSRNHTSSRFMSFGTSRSARLEQQLNSLVSSNVQNDARIYHRSEN